MYTQEYKQKLIDAAQKLRDEHAKIASQNTQVKDHFYYDPTCFSYKLKEDVGEKIPRAEHRDLLDELLSVASLMQESGVRLDFRETIDGWQIDLGYIFDLDCLLAAEIARSIDDLCECRSLATEKLLSRLIMFYGNEDALHFYLNAPEEDREAYVEHFHTVLQ